MCAVTYHRYQALKESLAAAISACHTGGDPRRPHALAVVSGLAANGYLASLLVARYFRLGDSHGAREAFDAAVAASSSASFAAPPKTLLYNAMLRGYLCLGLPHQAAALYRDMPPSCVPDCHTYHLAATACARASSPEAVDLGGKIASDAAARGLASDLLVGTALIGMHAEAGDMDAARRVFDGMPRRDTVVWNAVIGGYIRAGCLGDAVGLFNQMKSVDAARPTEATLVSLISGYADFGSWKGRGMLHAAVVKSGFHCNLFACNALLEMYAEFGCLNEAILLFRHMVVKDSVTWSSMIGALVRNGKAGYAIKLFHWMISKSAVSVTRSILLNVFMACAELGDWREGKWVQENYVLCTSSEFKRDPSVVTALIYMYAKCGKLDSSVNLLQAEIRGDVVAWNAMIKGCGELGQVKKAIGFAVEMQRIGVDPDAITFLEILPLISVIPSLKKGMEAHSQIVKRGFQNNRAIANSLICMYGRCGSLSLSIDSFSAIMDKDAVSWTSMMQVYAWHGLASEVVKLFGLMKTTKVQPNKYTFVAVLSACKNTGLVEQGMALLECMKEKYGLKPDIEHMSCVLDMLCRAGRLTDAYHLIQSSHSEHAKNPMLWGILLGGCRSLGNLMIGEAAARHLVSLDPENRANYKMLAEIYVSLGRRDDANDLLRLSMSRGLDLRPGFSWAEDG